MVVLNQATPAAGHALAALLKKSGYGFIGFVDIATAYFHATNILMSFVG